MNIVFRVDASIEIGTGHVMRCLALAEALRERGVRSRFLCRARAGNLIGRIRERGFAVDALPEAAVGLSVAAMAVGMREPAHAAWLGAHWLSDARQTLALLRDAPPDWLIVDHYALDARWEREVRQSCGGLMVIDDLADRPHHCDLLVDQNLGRGVADYEALVPAPCRKLTGPRYALLRSEFAKLRAYSLSRRALAPVKSILIAMGGVDRANASGHVLAALRDGELPNEIVVNVAMGPTAPWVDRVRAVASTAPGRANVLTDVQDMGQLMADSDLAIGAAGGSSWERCCLGVPTVLLALADNQRKVAEMLAARGAAVYAGDAGSGPRRAAAAAKSLLQDVELLPRLSQAGAGLCDGAGAGRVAEVVSSWANSHRVAAGMTQS
jgi:UDP-2,4-diacetamido-2,4,6-trideoxy-beta-L-altropyranose hydrolase